MIEFQELADEAFSDLLKKHGRPNDLKTALHESVKKADSRLRSQPGERPCPTRGPIRRRWSFPRVMRSMILAHSNSATTPNTVSVNLFSATPFRPSHIDKAAAVDEESIERALNGLTAIRIESHARLGPVSPDPSLCLMPQRRPCNASL